MVPDSNEWMSELSPVQKHVLLLVAGSAQASADFQSVVMFTVGSEEKHTCVPMINVSFRKKRGMKRIHTKFEV